MYKHVLIGVLLIVCAIGTAWFLMKPVVQESEEEVVAPPPISSTPVVFVSAESGESVFVTFGTSTALLNGIGYSNIELVQVEAASGAKYESKEENISLWNKETEVTITRGRKVLFVGVSSDSTSPLVLVATSSATTTTPASKISGSWLWVETIKGDQTIIPKKVDAFSITFLDGMLTGTTDCNGFSGAYTEDGSDISIGSLAMTKKFCEDSQEMEFTQQFIGSLSTSYSGTTLTLTHTDGTISRFEAK